MSKGKTAQELIAQMENSLTRIMARLTMCMLTNNIPLMIEEAIDEQFSLMVDLSCKLMLVDKSSKDRYDIKGIYDCNPSEDDPEIAQVSTRLIADYMYFATR